LVGAWVVVGCSVAGAGVVVDVVQAAKIMAAAVTNKVIRNILLDIFSFFHLTVIGGRLGYWGWGALCVLLVC
jgi:hypothetical protein